MEEIKDDLKLKPYDKLQSILSNGDGKLTDDASEKLDYLLGIKQKPNLLKTFLNKMRDFFIKMDGFIFRKNSRMFNTSFSKRKNEKSKRFH